MMLLQPNDSAALKSRLKATWMAGDFGRIAKCYETGAAAFVTRLGLTPGTTVLDVACGTGNLALPAARVGADVTGIDIAPNLLEQARAWAAAEQRPIQFDEGDAEQLPYPDAHFDTIISMFGVMFAPHPELATAELVRVCRPGGTIALANWTPSGFVGQMFKTIGRHVPPPAGMPSPILWGDEATVRERLSDACATLRTQTRTLTFAFPFSPSEVVAYWRNYYGPINRAFTALANEPAKQAALRTDLVQLWATHNRADDGTTRVEPEYLEVVAITMA